jgi:hypothetical protein
VGRTTNKEYYQQALKSFNRAELLSLHVAQPKTPADNIRNILFNPDYSQEEKSIHVYFVLQQFIEDAAKEDSNAVLGGGPAVKAFFDNVIGEILSDPSTHSQMKKLSQQTGFDPAQIPLNAAFNSFVSKSQEQARADLLREKENPSSGNEPITEKAYQLRLEQIEEVKDYLIDIISGRYEIFLEDIQRHPLLSDIK